MQDRKASKAVKQFEEHFIDSFGNRQVAAIAERQSGQAKRGFASPGVAAT